MLLALIRKELLLLRRDPHALMALFLMPMMFIIIMSLALKNSYTPRLSQFHYHILNEDQGTLGASFVAQWQQQHGAMQSLPSDPQSALQTGQLHYLIRLTPTFSRLLSEPKTPQEAVVYFTAEPTMNISHYRGTEANIAALIGELRGGALQERFMGLGDPNGQSLKHAWQANYAGQRQQLSAVQQNVPAWLVFGMFFVVTAIAGLLVEERQNGTLERQTSLGVRAWQLLASKGLPYLLVNALQAACMLAVGVWLMPHLGGDGLILHNIHWPALCLVLLSVSLAAIGLALTLAVIIRSHAQASTLGPILNLLMAALGGIMVPRFIMPDFMQKLASYSPMNWGLEGLLTVIARHGGLYEVLPMVSKLSLFAAVCYAIAIYFFLRRST